MQYAPARGERFPTRKELTKATKPRLLKALYEIMLQLQQDPAETWRSLFEHIVDDYTFMASERIPERVWAEWSRDPWLGVKVIGRRMNKEDIADYLLNVCRLTTWKKQVRVHGRKLTPLTQSGCNIILHTALMPPKKAIAIRKKQTKVRRRAAWYKPSGPGAKRAAKQFKRAYLDVLCADLSDDSTVPELRGMAKSLGIVGYSRMRKAQLCDSIAFELLPVYLPYE